MILHSNGSAKHSPERKDAFWLLKIHTGNFGVVNLQPIYSLLLGVLTILVTVSGALMLLKPQR